MPVEIDDQNFAGLLVSRVESYQPGKSPEELVETSLDQPIGSATLGCATYKWKLSRSAFLPIVLKAIVEMRAA
jgi:nickel-dependent lactate racemase